MEVYKHFMYILPFIFSYSVRLNISIFNVKIIKAIRINIALRYKPVL